MDGPANILERPCSADQAAIARSPEGISEHAMTGAWRVIIARAGEAARTWYFHENDDQRHKAVLHKQATEWLVARGQ